VKGVPAKRAAKSKKARQQRAVDEEGFEIEAEADRAQAQHHAGGPIPLGHRGRPVPNPPQERPRGSLQGRKTKIGQLQQRLKEMEKRFGPLFRKRVPKKKTALEKKSRFDSHAARKQNRSGVPNTLGGALAEIFVTIEHLYLYALTLKRADGVINPFPEVIEAKRAILKAIPVPPLRELDRVTLKVRRDRISRS
jgi:hypothetical protein